MPDLPTSYFAGTVAVGAGSTTVTGTGTSWVAAGLEAGDIFWAAGLSVRIASVNSPTSLTLAYPWPGGALSGANYEIRFTPDATRVLSAAREVLSALTNGNLSSLAGLATAANKLAYYTGAGTAALADLTTQARGLLGGTALSRSGSDYTLNGKLLGSVLAASAVDQTAGKLLTTGYGGLGATIALTSSDNLNDIAFGGLYFNSIGGNTAGNNYPVGSAGALIAIYRSSTGASQIYITYSDSPAIYFRSKGPSGWSVWRRLDGDRGSNGNGEYVRYADGTLICTRTLTASASATVTWTFPAAFSAAPVITGTAVATVLASVCLDSAPTTTSAALSVRDKTDARRADSMTLTAVGRWF